MGRRLRHALDSESALISVVETLSTTAKERQTERPVGALRALSASRKQSEDRRGIVREGFSMDARAEEGRCGFWPPVDARKCSAGSTRDVCRPASRHSFRRTGRVSTPPQLPSLIPLSSSFAHLIDGHT